MLACVHLLSTNSVSHLASQAERDMKLAFLILVVFVYTVSTLSVHNKTEAPVPVVVNRRQINDIYNAIQVCDVTYLVSDRQCVQNEDLFSGKSKVIIT